MTTPNVIRTSNVLMLLRGQNIYDPYYTGATYSRHTRVYTLPEMKILLESTGFSSVSLTTENVFSRSSTWKAAVMNSATQLLCTWMDKRHSGSNEAGSLRGDTIFAVARRKDQFMEKIPDPIVKGDKESLLKQREAFPSRI